jgi:hypothetical protein
MMAKWLLEIKVVMMPEVLQKGLQGAETREWAALADGSLTTDPLLWPLMKPGMCLSSFTRLLYDTSSVENFVLETPWKSKSSQLFDVPFFFFFVKTQKRRGRR